MPASRRWWFAWWCWRGGWGGSGRVTPWTNIRGTPPTTPSSPPPGAPPPPAAVSSPAPLIAAGGLFLIGFGILMMLNPQGKSSWVWRILVYVPRALAGLVIVAAGIALIGLGVWEWLQPTAFRAFAAALPRTLDQLLH